MTRESLPAPEPGYIEKPKEFQDIRFLPAEERVTILTVLQSGRVEFNNKEFTARYVRALKRGFDRFLRGRPFDFICLTDVGEVSDIDGVYTIPLVGRLPSKYCKLEIWRRDVHAMITTDQIFYIDLDSVLVDNVDRLFSFGGNFICLRHPYREGYVMGGFMSFRRDEMTYLFDRWMANLAENMRYYPLYKGRGDQLWIHRHGVYEPLYWDAVFPDDLVVNWHHKDRENVKIVFFSGAHTPEMYEDDPLMQRFWSHE